MLPTRRSQNWLPGIFNDFFGNEWMEKSTSPAINIIENDKDCLLYTSPSPRDSTSSRMPSSA